MKEKIGRDLKLDTDIVLVLRSRTSWPSHMLNSLSAGQPMVLSSFEAVWRPKLIEFPQN